METLDDDCCELEASTRHGNASRAAAIAKKLAEKKTPVSVRISDLPLDVPEIPVKYATLLFCVDTYAVFCLYFLSVRRNVCVKVELLANLSLMV